MRAHSSIVFFISGENERVNERVSEWVSEHSSNNNVHMETFRLVWNVWSHSDRPTRFLVCHLSPLRLSLFLFAYCLHFDFVAVAIGLPLMYGPMLKISCKFYSNLHFISFYSVQLVFVLLLLASSCVYPIEIQTNNNNSNNFQHKSQFDCLFLHCSTFTFVYNWFCFWRFVFWLPPFKFECLATDLQTLDDAEICFLVSSVSSLSHCRFPFSSFNFFVVVVVVIAAALLLYHVILLWIFGYYDSFLNVWARWDLSLGDHLHWIECSVDEYTQSA